MTLAGLGQWRRLAYRLLSQLFLPPDQGRVSALVSASARLRRESRCAASLAIYPQWQQLLATLARLKGQGAAELQPEYLRVFLHDPWGAPCLPYESANIAVNGGERALVPVLLEQQYAASGLALSPSPREAPDHVAVQLEFLSFLSGRQAEAWDADDARGALERQVAFLDRHVLTWFPRWTERVEAAGSSLYAVVAATARAFALHDRDLIGLFLAQETVARAAAPVGQ